MVVRELYAFSKQCPVSRSSRPATTFVPGDLVFLFFLSCVCVCVCVCIHTHICIYIYIYMCVCVCVCVCAWSSRNYALDPFPPIFWGRKQSSSVWNFVVKTRKRNKRGNPLARCKFCDRKKTYVSCINTTNMKNHCIGFHKDEWILDVRTGLEVH